MGKCSPITKLSCNGVMVISAFSFGCFGKSSAQLSPVSPLGEDSELQEGKEVQERGEGQDLRLCLVILAQCMGALHHLRRHPIPSTDPGRGPPNSDAISHCGGPGHTWVRGCTACGGC